MACDRPQVIGVRGWDVTQFGPTRASWTDPESLLGNLPSFKELVICLSVKSAGASEVCEGLRGFHETDEGQARDAHFN
jgi:hypothetical protein